MTFDFQLFVLFILILVC